MLSRFKALLRSVTRPPLHKPEVQLPYRLLGTDYGGWPLLTALTPPNPLIFSFGVGEDASFDLAAIEHFGARVYAFDPTPRSAAWVARNAFPESFVFHQCGLAAHDGESEFFAPERSDYVSFSAQPAPLSDRSAAIRAPVKRLSTIIADIGEGDPDVVKMDIEGFEYDVLEDILAGQVRPQQLLIEFHHRMYGIENQRTVSQVDRLRAAGYQIYYVSDIGHEYGLVHRSTLTS